MQGIFNYIPEINHVPRVYNVAAILWLRFMVHPEDELELRVPNV
jgi:hypothetical protein